MVCAPNNEALKNCIDEIVKNVKTKYFGLNPLWPTGPALLAKQFYPMTITSLELFHYKNIFEKQPRSLGVYDITKKVLEQYPEYREEQKSTQKTISYNDLWWKGKIYNE